MHIVVMGAGGIGGNIAGHLAVGGHHVTIVDHWAAHVDAINRDGLRLSGTRGEHLARPRALHVGDAWAVGEIDILVLGVKAFDNDWAVALLKPYLKPQSLVISAQNGVNEDHLAELVGLRRVIGCAILFSGETVGPGHVLMTSKNSRLPMGELHGRITPRLKEVQAIFQSVCAIPLTGNIWGELWAKLMTNVMSNPICGILGCRVRDAREQLAPRRAGLAVGVEAVRVGLALGIEFEPIGPNIDAMRYLRAAEGEGLEELEADIAAGGAASGDIYGSLTRDIMRGRKTEIDSFSGYIVQRGKETGIPTPANEGIYRLVKEVEAGRLKPGMHNAPLLPQLEVNGRPSP